MPRSLWESFASVRVGALACALAVALAGCGAQKAATSTMTANAAGGCGAALKLVKNGQANMATANNVCAILAKCSAAGGQAVNDPALAKMYAALLDRRPDLMRQANDEMARSGDQDRILATMQTCNVAGMITAVQKASNGPVFDWQGTLEDWRKKLAEQIPKN